MSNINGNNLSVIADITAEELFNMFFGGFPQQEFYMRRGGGRWMRQNEAQAQHAQSQVDTFFIDFMCNILYILYVYLGKLKVYFTFSKQIIILHSFKCCLCCY